MCVHLILGLMHTSISKNMLAYIHTYIHPPAKPTDLGDYPKETKIAYTLDGSTPQASATPSGYGAVVVNLGKSMPISAVAFQDEMIPSEVCMHVYVYVHVYHTY